MRTRWILTGLGGVLVVVCVVLALASSPSTRSGEAAERGARAIARAATPSHERVATTHPEVLLGAAGGAARTVAQPVPRGVPDHQAASPAHEIAPVTIDEAIALNPALAADLACRDPAARFNMDYDLRMIASLRSCLEGRTHSTGKFTFMMLFDNDPATRRGVGTGIEPQTSELSAEDDAVVLDCLKTYVVGSVLMSSEKFGKGPRRYRGNGISLPLDNSNVFRQVDAGTYTPGTPGCDYP